MLAMPALAGVNQGGVLVVHYDPAVTMTNHCDTSLLPRAESDLRCNAPIESGPILWQVLAAFPDSVPGRLQGVAFGLGDYDTTAVVMAAFSGCAPDVFELNLDRWPAPGSGTTVAFKVRDPQGGQLIPIYWFLTYAYADALVPLGPNPSMGGTWGDTQIPAVIDKIWEYGAMGFGSIGGRNPSPNPSSYLYATLLARDAEVADLPGPDGLPGWEEPSVHVARYTPYELKFPLAPGEWPPGRSEARDGRKRRAMNPDSCGGERRVQPSIEPPPLPEVVHPPTAPGLCAAIREMHYLAGYYTLRLPQTAPAMMKGPALHNLDGSIAQAGRPEPETYQEGPGWVLVYASVDPDERNSGTGPIPEKRELCWLQLFDLEGERIGGRIARGLGLGGRRELSWEAALWDPTLSRTRPVPIPSGLYLAQLSSESGQVEWTRLIVAPHPRGHERSGPPPRPDRETPRTR